MREYDESTHDTWSPDPRNKIRLKQIISDWIQRMQDYWGEGRAGDGRVLMEGVYGGGMWLRILQSLDLEKEDAAHCKVRSWALSVRLFVSMSRSTFNI